MTMYYSETEREFVEEADRLYEEAKKVVENRINRLRDEVILPFCKRHGLTMTTGMGMWSFEVAPGWEDNGQTENLDATWNGDTTWSYNWEAEVDYPEEWLEILHLLCSSVDATNGFTIGSWMKPITADEIGPPPESEPELVCAEVGVVHMDTGDDW